MTIDKKLEKKLHGALAEPMLKAAKNPNSKTIAGLAAEAFMAGVALGQVDALNHIADDNLRNRIADEIEAEYENAEE